MAKIYSTKVELTISCTGLKNRDTLSLSDPICAVYQRAGKKWDEIARTERAVNTLDPNFSKKIKLDYCFEEVQSFKFAVYDYDNESRKLSDDDFLGKMKCSLGQIVSSRIYEVDLLHKKNAKSKGRIKIVAEEISDNREISLSMKALKLDNKDFMGKSDPFLEFWRLMPDNSWSLAYRTEVIKNTLNPVWRPFSVSLHSLCGGNLSQKVKVLCNDWDSDGSHDLIGEFFTTVQEMLQTPAEYKCINPKKKEKKKYTHSGTVHVLSSKITKIHSFLDFIFGGLQLNFTVGVDFTGSNGDPRNPQSLHYMNPQQPNEYQQALWAVGNVVQDYDTDKLFPAFGFGAKVPPTNQVSHEFALNFNIQNPYCAGINGIMQAYQNALPQIALWGPTNISPIINHVARFAYQAQNTQTTPQNYYILLILTDGVITDMKETRDAIVNASNLPMSIIIVGVGQADFSAMSELDGDDGVLKSSMGQPVARDIVQFVPFHDYKDNSVKLARAVLAEVPIQVSRYFKQRGMPPSEPKQQAQTPQQPA